MTSLAKDVTCIVYAATATELRSLDEGLQRGETHLVTEGTA